MFNKAMTAHEKNAAAGFLDLADDYLRDGYRRPVPPYQFEDDAYPALSNSGEPDSLEQVAARLCACRACGLCRGRTRTVPGEGAARPLALVVGEGPGAEEDAAGRPFVGKAGQLLDRMLASVGLSRERNCFIANVVKCRPPENRDPLPEETAACLPFLARQIALLSPAVILCVGRVATQALLNTGEGIGRLRGNFTWFQGFTASGPAGVAQAPIPLLPAYHPSALLRDESLKTPAFQDLKLLMARLAGLDPGYAAEVRPLLQKYAATDAAFAARVREYLD
jgi:DNA polymerase